MKDVHLTQGIAQPTAGIRETIPAAQLPEFFDRVFTDVAARLAAAGERPGGPGYAHYRGRPTDTVDVEAGFLVGVPVSAEGLLAGSLPTGHLAQLDHRGGYEGLHQAYDGMAGWMLEQGLTPGEEMWEVYLVGPSANPDPSTWVTRILWPVRR